MLFETRFDQKSLEIPFDKSLNLRSRKKQESNATGVPTWSPNRRNGPPEGPQRRLCPQTADCEDTILFTPRKSQPSTPVACLSGPVMPKSRPKAPAERRMKNDLRADAPRSQQMWQKDPKGGVFVKREMGLSLSHFGAPGHHLDT